MYIDNNKGFSLIETIFTTLLFSLILQNIYIYTTTLNKEKNSYLKKIMLKERSETIFLKIQKSMDESLDYKIYVNDRMEKLINLSKNSELEGNTLIIEKYKTEDYKEVEIYHFYKKELVSAKGTIKNKETVMLVVSKEKILKKIDCKIYQEEFGVTIKGRFLNEEFKKEIKK